MRKLTRKCSATFHEVTESQNGWGSTKNANSCTWDRTALTSVLSGTEWLESNFSERVWWDVSPQCALAAMKTNCILGSIPKSATTRSREEIFPFNQQMGDCTWSTLASYGSFHKSNSNIAEMEQIQVRLLRWSGGWSSWHKERLKQLGLCSLEMRRQKRFLIKSSNTWKRLQKKWSQIHQRWKHKKLWTKVEIGENSLGQ